MGSHSKIQKEQDRAEKNYDIVSLFLCFSTFFLSKKKLREGSVVLSLEVLGAVVVSMLCGDAWCF